jgi:hypothetical protein
MKTPWLTGEESGRGLEKRRKKSGEGLKRRGAGLDNNSAGGVVAKKSTAGEQRLISVHAVLLKSAKKSKR